MQREECINASVFIGGLNPTKRYHISLVGERGLGFSDRCVQRNTGFTDLTGHRIYRFSFPLIACGPSEFGTITANVREALSGELVATKTTEVMVAPAPPMMEIASYTLGDDGCNLGIPFGEPSSAGGWTENGAAYSATTALFLGTPVVSLFATIAQGGSTGLFCVVGALERTVSSRQEGEAIHTISVTMTKKNGDTRWVNRVQTCTYSGLTCWSLNNTFTNKSLLGKIKRGDRFDLAGNHRITSGDDTISFSTSISVQE